MREFRMFATVVFVCVALLLSVAAASVRAQSFQGAVRGTVKDPQGVIPGVTVTLLNEQNNVTRETVTNEVGEYSRPSIPPRTPSGLPSRDSRRSSAKACASARSSNSRSTSLSNWARSRKRSR